MKSLSPFNVLSCNALLTCVCVLPPAGEQRVCAWAVGGATAGAGLPAQSQPRAWQHSERQTGPEEYDKLLMRPAYWLPHLRVPPHHLIRWGAQPAPVCVGRACQPTQHLHLAHQQLGQVHGLQLHVTHKSFRVTKGDVSVTLLYVSLQVTEGLWRWL